MNPILKRTLSGLTVGLLVVGLFLYCPLHALLPIVAVLAALAQFEFYQMAKMKYEPVAWFGILMGLAWMTAVGVMGFGARRLIELGCGSALAVTAAAFLLCAFVTFNSRYKNPLGTIASTLAGFFYVPFLMSFFLLLAQIGAPAYSSSEWVSRTGLYTLFALIAITKFSDTGGFAFGMAFGKHKMCPSISPKKSWEGLAGSMLFSAIVAALMLYVARRFNWGADLRVWKELSYPVAMVGGALLALVGTAGDLIESRFKREFDIKDSATFMPAGMGGFLDMFDSVLFIPALAYPIIVVFTR